MALPSCRRVRPPYSPPRHVVAAMALPSFDAICGRADAALVVVCGRAGPLLTAGMLHALRCAAVYAEVCVVMCDDPDALPLYGECVPAAFIHDHVTEALLETLNPERLPRRRRVCVVIHTHGHGMSGDALRGFVLACRRCGCVCVVNAHALALLPLPIASLVDVVVSPPDADPALGARHPCLAAALAAARPVFSLLAIDAKRGTPCASRDCAADVVRPPTAFRAGAGWVWRTSAALVRPRHDARWAGFRRVWLTCHLCRASTEQVDA